MKIDLKTLYDTVDQLDTEQRAKLMDYLASGYRTDESASQSSEAWQFNLARGAIQTTPDFDDPLPDEFWLGES